LTQPSLLLIDDEPALAGFVAHVGRSCGYSVIFTTSAAVFRREFDTSEPAVITIDLGMPGGDGIELLRFLAERGCSSPIIIISGFDRRMLAAAFSLGEELGLQMVGPLSKPVHLHELREILTRLNPQSRAP